jgi:PTH1 family peptidyl-tRNA hydrolase
LELLAKLARQKSGGNNFPDWKEDGKIKALISKGELDGEKMTFVLPNNFMNNSGKSVLPLIKNKKDLDKLVVIYDDLDLPIGKIKLSYNRSSGGHNGLGSIIKNVKSEEFLRIRVGVSPHTPSGKTKKPKGEDAVLKFLLKEFKEPEMKEIKKIAKIISEALVTTSSSGKDKAMSIFNQ